MIVNKPIGAVKIGGNSHRLTVGKPVPEIVIKFWKSRKIYQAMIDGGFISESGNVEKKPEAKSEKKTESKVEKKFFEDEQE